MPADAPGSLAVSHTRDVVLALEWIISLAKDAETGQRDHLITGEERYLAPYRSAIGAIGDQLKLLEDLTANSDLHSRLPALKARIETRMAILRGNHRIAPEPRFYRRRRAHY